MTELTSRKASSEAIERTFGLGPTVDGLPAALGAAMLDLAKLASSMNPDDVCLQLDVACGTLTFRAYRRDRGR